jgi:hypothetical protein
MEKVRLRNFAQVLLLETVWEFIWNDHEQGIVHRAASWLWFPRLNYLGQLGELAYLLSLERALESEEEALNRFLDEGEDNIGDPCRRDCYCYACRRAGYASDSS